MLTVVGNVWLFRAGLFDTLHLVTYVELAGLAWMLIGQQRLPRLIITVLAYGFIAWAFYTAAPTSYTS